jgi:rhomboid protease GluP
MMPSSQVMGAIEAQMSVTDTLRRLSAGLRYTNDYSLRSVRAVRWAAFDRDNDSSAIDRLAIATGLLVVDPQLRSLAADSSDLPHLAEPSANALISDLNTVDYSRDAQRLFGKATRRARYASSAVIEPEHLVLALLDGHGAATEYLVAHLGRSRRSIERALLDQLDPARRRDYAVLKALSRPWTSPMPVTYGLAAVIILVYVAIWIDSALFQHLVAAPRSVAAGQAYRLVTAMLLHGNVSHLVGNVVVLVWFGSVAERAYGWSRYVLLYGATGIISMLGAIELQPCYTVAGASGAILGVIGGLLIYLLSRKSPVMRLEVARVGGVVLVIFGADYLTDLAGQPNMGHVVGFAAGMLLGLITTNSGGNAENTSLLSAARIAVLITLCVALGLSLVQVCPH